MGAALATVLGQIASAVMSLKYLYNIKSFRLERKSFVINASVLKKFLLLGISSLLTQVSIVVIM